MRGAEMTRITRLDCQHTEFIPERLQPGVLYVSKRYSTASHLCCCGCGQEVVTPLKPSKWKLSEKGGTASLWPSIGNWSFPCQSHYIIRDGRIVWAKQFSKRQIALVQSQDLLATQTLYAPRPVGLVAFIARALVRIKEDFAKFWRIPK